MELTPESRAALAKHLLESLEVPDAEEHESLWVEESARRYDDLVAGRARSIASDELFAKLARRDPK